jgi:methylated-DNA-[protein]-cysteine S-methyltransferase
MARWQKELGAGPEGARDVGQAMAENPVPLIIPCHRVLAAGGKVGGFSAPGGAAAKSRMLALEGIELPSAQPAQQSFRF